MDFDAMLLTLEFLFGLVFVFFIGYLIAYVIEKLFHVKLYFEEKKSKNANRSSNH
jgi:uncharacterized membrane protein